MYLQLQPKKEESILSKIVHKIAKIKKSLRLRASNSSLVSRFHIELVQNVKFAFLLLLRIINTPNKIAII